MGRFVVSVCCLIGVLPLNPTFAQTPPPQSDLGAIPGMTESQSITGKAIKEVWEPLFGKDDQLNAEQKDMFDRCRELVQTSNFQQGVGPTAFKIEEIQTNEQLAAAVQQVSQVAKLSQMTGAVKSASAQFTNIGAHLLELRQGVLPQLLVGAYKPTPFVSIADANVADSSFTGGGASADSALPSQKLGVFVNGNFVFGNRDGTSREDGLDFDNKGFTAGVDYRFTDDLALGLAFGFNNVHTDLANGAGDSDTNSYTVSTFGNYYVNNFFVTGIFSYAALDHEISRTIAYPTVNRQANGDTNGDLYGATLGFGYDFYVDKFTVSPLARCNTPRHILTVSVKQVPKDSTCNMEIKISNRCYPLSGQPQTMPSALILACCCRNCGPSGTTSSRMTVAGSEPNTSTIRTASLGLFLPTVPTGTISHLVPRYLARSLTVSRRSLIMRVSWV